MMIIKRIRASKTFWRFTMAEGFGFQGSYTVEMDATVTDGILPGWDFKVRVYSMAAYNGDFALSGRVSLSVGVSPHYKRWGLLYVTRSDSNWIEARCLGASVFVGMPPMPLRTVECIRACIEVHPIVEVVRDVVPLGSSEMYVVLREQFPPRPSP